MDRQIEYAGQILTDVELLTIQRNALVSLGWLAQAVLGTAPSVTGLACAPTSPASMSVQVGTGAIYALETLDATAYGSLVADTSTPHQIVKQGLNLSTQTLACPAPTTTGQSIVYLIEAGYQDYDTNSMVLQYFDSANPSVAFTGPNGTGAAQNTTRQGLCSVLVKAGVAATTGSQTAPAADSGYVGLYTVTVAYGATTISSGNITAATTSPAIPYTLPALGAAYGTLQASLVNIQTIQNTTLTSISGSGANTYTTAFSGTINKESATSNLVFWTSCPTLATATGPTIIKITVATQSITNLCINSTSSANASSSQIDGVFVGLPSGTLNWTIAFARGDSTAWSCSANPNNSISAPLPPTTLTSLIFGEI